jgi:hypothetical protein
MPLDTRWISWVLLVTVVVWLLVTRKLRVKVKAQETSTKPASFSEVDCERFPDQCPCTTELGKGVA